MDLQGIGAIITSIGVIGTVALGLLNRADGRARDRKISQVHELVNGQSKKLEDFAEAKGFTAGQKSGRAHPKRTVKK